MSSKKAVTRSVSKDSELDEESILKCVERMLISDSFLKKLTSLIKEEVKSSLSTILTEQNKKIKHLEDTIEAANESMKCLKDVFQPDKDLVDKLEQRTKRSTLRIYGMKEEPGEKVINQIKNLGKRMDIQISDDEIENCYRLGAKEDGIRPIIVEFQSTRLRDTIFNTKKKLKGSKIVLREDLTKLRLSILTEAKNRFGPNSVWSFAGFIYFKYKNRINKVSTFKQFYTILNK